MSMTHGRASRLASSCPKDFDFEFFVYQKEANYKIWWSWKQISERVRSISDDTAWNCMICILVLVCLVYVAADYSDSNIVILDIAYNGIYAVHVICTNYENFRVAYSEGDKITSMQKYALILDVLSYLHYVALALNEHLRTIKIICYYIRMHTPFRYLWALTDSNLKGSVIGTALKYFYIFLVLRITCAFMWIHIDALEVRLKTAPNGRRAMHTARFVSDLELLDESGTSDFVRAVYIVNKMFMPIGPSVHPANDFERLACLFVMMLGSLVVTGAAVASLALVISLYMRPEEEFRARFRLIMDELKTTHVAAEVRERVETFYRMYWHKQKAVSVTQLLPIFPSTLPCTIYTDIYFEAQQKSPILRDLSYPFLWEVAKTMSTIHYIPGDAIIKRTSKKSSVIYITYGDVEMLTAEDDDTAILRMTRGTIINPCGGCASMACGRALVEIRAATFCTAHVLTAADLWRVSAKHGKHNGQAFIILSSFEEHFEKVKRHYKSRALQQVKYKSSILQFKRNLMALKEAKDDDGRLLLACSDYFLEVAASYIMRNRSDSSLTDEADDICLRPTFPFILQPASSLIVAWHFFVSMVIVVVCVTHPYHLVYLKTVPLEFSFFDYVVTAIFTLDLLVHLSTGANVEEGVAITFAQTSTQQMQNKWFVLDVLGTLPIFEFVDDGKYAGINKLLRLPKVFRILKSMEEMCVYHSNVLRFLSYTLMMLIACYLIAALQQGFMCAQFEFCLVTNFTHTPYWEQKPLDEETVPNRLIYSLYWAISILTFTTHKTQSWQTDSWHNLLFTSLLLEACVILYTFMEAVYSATIMVTTALREDYDNCISNVKHFLIRNNVDPMLRSRFITYLQLCWHTDKAYSMTHKKTSIFFDLPPHVFQDIVASQRIKYILCIPVMKYLHNEDLKIASSRALLFYTSPNEILLNTGDISNEIFVIKQGMCEVLDPDSKAVVTTITVKECFGVLECLARFPAYYTIRAVTHVQVFSISRKYLPDLNTIPKMKDAVEFVKQQPEYKGVQNRRDSFLTYEPPPPPPNRQTFPLPRKFEPDSAFMHPFNRLGFLSVLRYIFPRYTIRPDGKYIQRYEWFRAVCAFTTSMIFPSYTYLSLQYEWIGKLTTFLDLTAYLDIFQRMLVGYYNEDGILVYHPASTAAHYMKGPFLVDILGAVPLELTETEREAESIEGGFSMVSASGQFLMLNRLIQLYRVPGAMDILFNYCGRGDVILVVKAIPLFMVLINVLTCLMVFHSVEIYKPQATKWEIKPLADEGGSWLYLFDNIFRFNMTESPWNMHLSIYFWVVYETTTTGYNTFNPSNISLMQILFIGMVCGAMMTTFFAVRIISIRANVNKMLAAYQQNMRDISIYMKREKLSRDLQQEVLSHYEYTWDKTGGTDYRNVLKLCDQITLRTDAILHLYGSTFAKCPILYHCDVSLLRVVGRAVRSVYFLAHTRIIQKDDILHDMFFIDYGYVDVRQTMNKSCTSTRLTRGSVYGNMENLHAVRCPNELVAITNVHLLQINSQMMHRIIIDFPSVKVLLNKYRPHNENYIVGSLGETSGATKERRSPSAPMITLQHTGIAKYLNVDSRLVQYYLILVSLLCIYADIYNAGFEADTIFLIGFLYVMDAAFLAKVLMLCIGPYLIETGDVKNVFFESRKDYIKDEFKYDILSCLPLELFCLMQTDTDAKWRLFGVLRLNRLLRLVTVSRCLKRHKERLSINLVFSTIAAVSIWFSLYIHTLTAIWYAIGTMEDRISPNSSWIHKDDGTQICDNLYVCSMYFILTTFTQNGVGDILPKKQSEVIFVIILAICSTMIYMIYVGEFSNIIQYQSFRSFGYYCKHLELQEFLRNNRVSKNLVKRVNRYSLHLWREKRGVQVPFFLDSAPPCYKLKIMSAAYIRHLQIHPAFRDCEPAFLRQLVGCLRLYTYSPDIFVVKESEITDSMYLIHKGRVNEIDEEMDETIDEFNAGENFGMMQGLVRDTPYNYSYKTVRKSEVLTLHLNKWEYLLKLFPESRSSIYKNIPGHPYSKPPNQDDDRKDKKGFDDGGHGYPPFMPSSFPPSPPGDTTTTPQGYSYPYPSFHFPPAPPGGPTPPLAPGAPAAADSRSPYPYPYMPPGTASPSGVPQSPTSLAGQFPYQFMPPPPPQSRETDEPQPSGAQETSGASQPSHPYSFPYPYFIPSGVSPSPAGASQPAAGPSQSTAPPEAPPYPYPYPSSLFPYPFASTQQMSEKGGAPSSSQVRFTPLTAPSGMHVPSLASAAQSMRDTVPIVSSAGQPTTTTSQSPPTAPGILPTSAQAKTKSDQLLPLITKQLIPLAEEIPETSNKSYYKERSKTDIFQWPLESRRKSFESVKDSEPGRGLEVKSNPSLLPSEFDKRMKGLSSTESLAIIKSAPSLDQFNKVFSRSKETIYAKIDEPFSPILERAMSIKDQAKPEPIKDQAKSEPIEDGEPSHTLIRSMTESAKKLIIKNVGIDERAGEIGSKEMLQFGMEDKDVLLLEEDIKTTSAFIKKRIGSTNLTTEAVGGEKSLLSKYFNKEEEATTSSKEPANLVVQMDDGSKTSTYMSVTAPPKSLQIADKDPVDLRAFTLSTITVFTDKVDESSETSTHTKIESPVNWPKDVAEQPFQIRSVRDDDDELSQIIKQTRRSVMIELPEDIVNKTARRSVLPGLEDTEGDSKPIKAPRRSIGSRSGYTRSAIPGLVNQQEPEAKPPETYATLKGEDLKFELERLKRIVELKDQEAQERTSLTSNITTQSVEKYLKGTDALDEEGQYVRDMSRSARKSVRYEDDEEVDDVIESRAPVGPTEQQRNPVSDLTAEERNLIMLDSDVAAEPPLPWNKPATQPPKSENRDEDN